MLRSEARTETCDPVEVMGDTFKTVSQHRPAVVWFTGLSGAGKTTLANLVEHQLRAQGVMTAVLDGDDLRHGLSSDLGFTDADRRENMRRVAEVARLMADAGLVVLVALIAPFRDERAMARALLEPRPFIEAYVDAPLEVVEARDPKGLYKKARAGLLANFTGVDSPYEPPANPQLWLRTSHNSPSDCAAEVVRCLQQCGVVAAQGASLTSGARGGLLA